MSELFKTEKFLGVDWLRNATEKGGAQDEVIRLKSNDSNIVLNHVSATKKYAKSKIVETRMWASCDLNALLPMVENNNGLYEVIHKFPHKVYFDIDSKYPELDGTNELCNDKIWDDIYHDYTAEQYPAFGGPFTDSISFIDWLKLYYKVPEKK